MFCPIILALSGFVTVLETRQSRACVGGCQFADGVIGPNATLIEDDFEAVIRRLKAQLEGEIDVAGPNLAGSLTNLGLIDEYRLYIHPIVLGSGQPFFAGRGSALWPATALAGM
jgi:dihydrofolate reductase